MNIQEKEDVGKALVLMWEAYDKIPKPTVLKLYLNYLDKFSVLDSKKAIAKAIETCRYLPTIAEISSLLKPSKQDLICKAEQEFATLKKACFGRSDPNYKMIDEIEDEVTQFLIETRFNVKQMLSPDEDFWIWQRKEFVDAYLNYTSSDSMQEHIKLGKGTAPLQITGLADALTKNRLNEGEL